MQSNVLLDKLMMMMPTMIMIMLMVMMNILTGYRKRAWVIKDATGIPIAAFFCLMVYMIRDWRYLQLSVALMGALSLITWFFIDESGMRANQYNRSKISKVNKFTNKCPLTLIITHQLSFIISEKTNYIM